MEWKDVYGGVIQGSVLGPTFFILFISDINDYIPEEAELEKFADDILSYLLGKSSSFLTEEIINGVNRWCKDNKMRLNPIKCKVIFTPVKDNLSPPKLQLDGNEIETVSSFNTSVLK
ncbi:unnamed protein product [Brachionus calyciflorus]|uniref:Reverse transcriptase domain-containing protein n=1 Tax=Brachionus calyciflorus TaxID=104777 RepID=A0A814IQZ2_9BILA|nr:unnamed protein product [Brachionus calyciflorus]